MRVPAIMGAVLKRRTLFVPVLLLAIAAVAKERIFQMPKAFHAKTYPAVDAHEDEKLAIAADPYDMPDKAAIFTTDYRDKGLLPIYVIFSNDDDEAISLGTMRVQLVTKRRDKIEPATLDDIYRRISKQKARGDEQGTPRLPVPIPRRGTNNRNLSADAQLEVESMQFLAKAVEPHSTKAGFMTFDVRGIDNPLAGAHLVLTGIRRSDGTELFYFEIPLEKYLGYKPGN
jgi:hypothetical protein